jgi:hypothetical protein
VPDSRHTTGSLWEQTANLLLTNDWVAIRWDESRRERQCAVVTAERGALASRRVVRGREADTIADRKSA